MATESLEMNGGAMNGDRNGEVEVRAAPAPVTDRSQQGTVGLLVRA